MNENDIGKKRTDACVKRLSALNDYVMVKAAKTEILPSSLDGLMHSDWDMKIYDVIILTEAS